MIASFVPVHNVSNNIKQKLTGVNEAPVLFPVRNFCALNLFCGGVGLIPIGQYFERMKYSTHKTSMKLVRSIPTVIQLFCSLYFCCLYFATCHFQPFLFSGIFVFLCDTSQLDFSSKTFGVISVCNFCLRTTSQTVSQVAVYFAVGWRSDRLSGFELMPYTGLLSLE